MISCGAHGTVLCPSWPASLSFIIQNGYQLLTFDSIRTVWAVARMTPAGNESVIPPLGHNRPKGTQGGAAYHQIPRRFPARYRSDRRDQRRRSNDTTPTLDHPAPLTQLMTAASVPLINSSFFLHTRAYVAWCPPGSPPATGLYVAAARSASAWQHSRGAGGNASATNAPWVTH